MAEQPRSRQPKGVPVGGQYAAEGRGEVDVDLDSVPDPFDDDLDGATLVSKKPTRSSDPFPEGALLQHFKIAGFDRRIFKAAHDAPSQPGGMCWHCGQAIMNCVVVEHRTTGQTETIGVDCAARVGLDRDQVRRMMRELYAERDASRRQRAAEREQAETARYGPHGSQTRHDDGGCRCKECVETNQHGDHGTLERFSSGCFCDDCCDKAPHGSLVRFNKDECVCPECAAVAVAEGGCSIEDRPVLVDAETGEPVEGARLVNTRYGTSWVIDDPAGGEPTWVSAFPKRRSTIANKGFLEADAPSLVRNGRNGSYTFGQVAAPLIDNWGEPLPGVDPDAAAAAKAEWEQAQRDEFS